jgi:hypothetical protein
VQRGSSSDSAVQVSQWLHNIKKLISVVSLRAMVGAFGLVGARARMHGGMEGVLVKHRGLFNRSGRYANE